MYNLPNTHLECVLAKFLQCFQIIIIMFLLPVTGCCLLLLGKAKELGFVTKNLVHLSSGCFVFFTNRHVKPVMLVKQFGVLLGMECCINARCWPRQSNALEPPRKVLQWMLGALLPYSAQYLKLMHGRQLR